MQDSPSTSLGVSILEGWRATFAPPVRDSGHLLEVDVGRDDPELLALFEDSIQLFAVTNAVRVFVVEEDCWPVVRTNLMERVAGKTTYSRARSQ